LKVGGGWRAGRRRRARGGAAARVMRGGGAWGGTRGGEIPPWDVVPRGLEPPRVSIARLQIRATRPAGKTLDRGAAVLTP